MLSPGITIPHAFRGDSPRLSRSGKESKCVTIARENGVTTAFFFHSKIGFGFEFRGWSAIEPGFWQSPARVRCLSVHALSKSPSLSPATPLSSSFF